MSVRNGLIPADLLVPLRDQPTGARLVAPAAVSWERMADECRARFGWRPQVTSGADAYRLYSVQERIFRQRYTSAYSTGIDRRWWDSDGDGTREAWWRLPVWAAAAVPGTSNHGLGLACDITALGGFKGERYRQLASIAAAHGWDNNEGRSIAEAWHWVYKPHLDRVANTVTGGGPIDIPTPGGSLPAPLEEDDMPTADEVAAAILNYVPPDAPEDTPSVYGLLTRTDIYARSTYAAVLGADAAEAARDAEDDEQRQAILNEATSGRKDFLRADPVTRAQLTEALDLIRTLTKQNGA